MIDIITRIIIEVLESIELPNDATKSISISGDSVICTIRTTTNYDHYLYARLFVLERMWKSEPDDLHHLNINLSIKRCDTVFDTSVILRLVLPNVGPSIFIHITSDDEDNGFTYITTITHRE